jgi:Tol biopolymer transport system component
MIGEFDHHHDVGDPALSGSAVYDDSTQTYTITGANMWYERDEFHFVWKRMTGDFILTAEAAFLGEGVDPHRKLGWVVRSSLDAASPHVAVAVHGDGLTSLQFRRTAGAETEERQSTLTAPGVIRLERHGDTCTMSVAHRGEPFVSEELTGVDLGDEVYVGLFVCSHNPDVRETATFRNVRIVVPAPADFRPYQDYIGSNLEVVDVETGHREILYQSPRSLQAPNWTPDGQALIYNSEGLLYRFDLERRTPEVIPTDFATSNNNDHVLSFDGSMLGISHHADDHGDQSLVYTVPVEGGTPRLVTEQGPSYLHGWSPDGRFLLYTAERGDGNYDIYRVPAEGGEEVRLTTDEALDDGPEYAPDGASIYFNSARSGRMQIWRMNADGSGQEPLTDDSYNNWFPHVSPDGRWIVFLSYPSDIDPADHPFYERVTLRIMPVDGGTPRVLAYVYGGQGTINVPSWSPDSRRVAFVSNTTMD